MDCIASLPVPPTATPPVTVAAPVAVSQGGFAVLLAQAIAPEAVATPKTLPQAETSDIDPAAAVATGAVVMPMPAPPPIACATCGIAEPSTAAATTATPDGPADARAAAEATAPVADAAPAVEADPPRAPDANDLAAAMPAAATMPTAAAAPPTIKAAALADGPPAPARHVTQRGVSGSISRDQSERSCDEPPAEPVPGPGVTPAAASGSATPPTPVMRGAAKPLAPAMLRQPTASDVATTETPSSPPPTGSMPVPPMASAAAADPAPRGTARPAQVPEAPVVTEAAAPASTTPSHRPQEARAAEAPPPAAAPPPATPARQIAPVLVSVAIAGGTARLSVTLEPAELGRVEISVERQGDTAEVRVIAERPETLALIQRDQRELDRALNQAGIAADGRSLSFMLSDGGGGFAERRDSDGRAGAARGLPSRDADAADTAAPPPHRSLSLIDLAV